jgi:hypothetical protein
MAYVGVPHPRPVRINVRSEPKLALVCAPKQAFSWDITAHKPTKHSLDLVDPVMPAPCIGLYGRTLGLART